MLNLILAPGRLIARIIASLGNDPPPAAPAAVPVDPSPPTPSLRSNAVTYGTATADLEDAMHWHALELWLMEKRMSARQKGQEATRPSDKFGRAIEEGVYLSALMKMQAIRESRVRAKALEEVAKA